MDVIAADHLTKIYRAGDVEVQAVRDATFRVAPGSFASFVGPSGSGKSTLLNMIGCLDRPTTGRLTVLGTDVTQLDRRASAAFRGQNIGFIFQDFNLVPVLTAYGNVEYPLIMVQSWPARKRRERVMGLLEAVGMADQAFKRPDQISGGQKQRVAVARALASDTKLVLADEPTANLDQATAVRVIDLMKRLRDDLGVTFVFSTHDPKIMAEAEVIFHLRDGAVVEREERRVREHV
jgi:putative ABC transport system ATP-binding protein